MLAIPVITTLIVLAYVLTIKQSKHDKYMSLIFDLAILLYKADLIRKNPHLHTEQELTDIISQMEELDSQIEQIKLYL